MLQSYSILSYDGLLYGVKCSKCLICSVYPLSRWQFCVLGNKILVAFRVDAMTA